MGGWLSLLWLGWIQTLLDEVRIVSIYTAFHQESNHEICAWKTKQQATAEETSSRQVQISSSSFDNGLVVLAFLFQVKYKLHGQEAHPSRLEESLTYWWYSKFFIESWLELFLCFINSSPRFVFSLLFGSDSGPQTLPWSMKTVTIPISTLHDI